MQSTKNDLSAGLVRLDIEAMQKTAAYAVRELRARLHSLINASYDQSLNPSSSFHLDANDLKQAASEYAVAVETYYTLVESTKREEIELVNRV